MTTSLSNLQIISCIEKIEGAKMILVVGWTSIFMSEW